MELQERKFIYNTDRKPLKIPEYGRYIHQMVEQLKTIKDREKRNKNVHLIISILGRHNTHLRDVPEFQHKLWDHLFIMADFDLDVDSPFPKPSPDKLKERPQKLPYPNKGYQFRFYGHIIKQMIDEAVKFEEGELKERLFLTIANHMKKNYLTWNKEWVDDDVIFEHLKILSNGKIDLKDKDVKLKANNQLVRRKKHNSYKKKNHRKKRS